MDARNRKSSRRSPALESSQNRPCDSPGPSPGAISSNRPDGLNVQRHLSFNDSIGVDSTTSGNTTTSDSSPEPLSPLLHPPGSRLFIANYLSTQMFGSGDIPNDDENESSVKKIRNFVAVPLMIEGFVWLGLFVCLDSFLFVFTYLPIRFLYAVWLRVKYYGQKILTTPSESFRRRVHSSAHVFDLARGLLFIICLYFLSFIQMSRIYHNIRGQTMIKLYVLTSMLEVFDRLLCSFGQDSFASLYAQIRSSNNPSFRDCLFFFFVMCVYVSIHSFTYFVHLATLTVAINSSDQALATVFVLNNFAELKSYVFKKFELKSLFQLACADVTERFQISLFVILIALVSLAQTSSTAPPLELLSSHAYPIALMVCGEAVADWIKHAFISKFNDLDASVYRRMGETLRSEIVHFHQKSGALDSTHGMSRKLGLSQIPLGCVAARYAYLAVDSPWFQDSFSHMSNTYFYSLMLAVFLSLVLIKSVLGIGLVIYASSVPIGSNSNLADSVLNPRTPQHKGKGKGKDD